MNIFPGYVRVDLATPGPYHGLGYSQVSWGFSLEVLERTTHKQTKHHVVVVEVEFCVVPVVPTLTFQTEPRPRVPKSLVLNGHIPLRPPRYPPPLDRPYEVQITSPLIPMGRKEVPLLVSCVHHSGSRVPQGPTWTWFGTTSGR